MKNKTTKDEVSLVKLIEKEIDFEVSIPHRFWTWKTPSTIRVKKENGEYVYVPRKHTWFADVIFSSSELFAIAKKLEELNQDKNK